eukprot:1136288-Pelagomonas_calceolata.AAC.2
MRGSFLNARGRMASLNQSTSWWGGHTRSLKIVISSLEVQKDCGQIFLPVPGCLKGMSQNKSQNVAHLKNLIKGVSARSRGALQGQRYTQSPTWEHMSHFTIYNAWDVGHGITVAGQLLSQDEIKTDGPTN